MDCDIHLHAEVKINGRWEHYSVCPGQRTYELFARMANVRNHTERKIEPISLPRGLPDDVSYITRLEYEAMIEDAHSCSWLSLEEVGELEEWWENRVAGIYSYRSFNISFACYLTRNGWRRESLLPEFQDARLVFWFDN